jgi:LacI family transcriptional regulator
MGGGNRSILKTLEDHRLKPDVYVAHDLDQDNRALIAERKLDYILYHDLRLDIRNAFNAFLRFHRLTTDEASNPISTVQVLTPENIPDDTQTRQRSLN